MNKVLIIVVCFLLMSCKADNLIRNNNIAKLVLVELLDQNKEKQHAVNNRDSINSLVKTINSADKDPAVFITKYKIIIYYNDNVNDTVLCNSKRIKVDGITYKLDKNLKEIISAP
ncbi:hypothetical protein [Bacteroides sedimenti]|uniref:Lipoprotein n=1 Tax=Bacteroides sedimenti TaxID=2136147 RepID=A0ABM8IE74_9BACE